MYIQKKKRKRGNKETTTGETMGEEVKLPDLKIKYLYNTHFSIVKFFITFLFISEYLILFISNHM